MYYGQLKVASVVMHIAGPSGSGKTTLLEQIKQLHPNYATADIDDFDVQAEKNLKYDKVRKDDYSDMMLQTLHNEKQKLLDKFIAKNKQIILAGHHTEAGHVLNIPTQNRFMLPTSASVSARRAFEREKGHHPGHERLESEIPDDIRIAKDVIKELRSLGYTRTYPKDILAQLKKAPL